MSVPHPTPIVHLTHMKNLPSILEAGGILSYNEMSRRGLAYQNIAYNHIQQRRANTMVFGASGGCLHDYAPFHFGPKSPMLYAVSNGRVEGYEEGQEPLLYLVSSAQAVEEAGVPFAFTDGHAIMALSEQFFDLSSLDQIDWGVVRGRYWFDSDQYPDRCRRREAEFLVHQMLPTRLVQEIVVLNAGTRDKILEILTNSNVEVPVQIRPNWYY